MLPIAEIMTKVPKMDVPKIVVKPGEGRSVWLGGMGVVVQVLGDGHWRSLRGRGTPDRTGDGSCSPHAHPHENEHSYVLEGTIGARVGDHEIAAGPGSYLIKPRELMHTFRNAGSGPAPIMEVIVPAGFEGLR